VIVESCLIVIAICQVVRLFRPHTINSIVNVRAKDPDRWLKDLMEKQNAK
jgi:hypothetical protein